MTITQKEFHAMESGTRATKVRCYNDSGNLVGLEYVLRDEDYAHDLEQAQAVADGYFTDSVNVSRK